LISSIPIPRVQALTILFYMSNVNNVSPDRLQSRSSVISLLTMITINLATFLAGRSRPQSAEEACDPRHTIQ
jgi:hypothetical protein